MTLGRRCLSSVPDPGLPHTFGNAEESQLERMAELTYGDVFDGTRDLWTSFAKAKGKGGSTSGLKEGTLPMGSFGCDLFPFIAETPVASSIHPDKYQPLSSLKFRLAAWFIF